MDSFHGAWGKWIYSENSNGGTYLVCLIDKHADFRIDLDTCVTKEGRDKWIQRLKDGDKHEQGGSVRVTDYDIVGLRKAFEALYGGESGKK